jgi:TonB family protein
MSQRNGRSALSDLDGVTHWLIHHAARRAPDSLSSRLEEEWLADLESRSSALSRLRLAVGCCWATVVIVNEYPRSRVAAASSAAAARGFITLADQNVGYFSLRSGTLFLIAGLHAALIYGLITTFSHMRVSEAPRNLQNHEITPVPRERVSPPPPGSVFKNWAINVPKPVVDVPPKIDFDIDVTAEVTENPPEVNSQPLPPETPPHVVKQVPGGPRAGFPDTADFYPSISIYLAEQGSATVRVCVDTEGRLTSDPTTVKSSGNSRLDAAALRLAKAGSGFYRASTEDGRPVNSCYPFGIRFQLKK